MPIRGSMVLFGLYLLLRYLPAEYLHLALSGPSAGAARLAPAIRDVLSEAVAAGGSTLRDHAQPSGELGYFQHSFRVYGREGQPCPTPGCGGIIHRIAQLGRSTFYCPRCQK